MVVSPPHSEEKLIQVDDAYLHQRTKGFNFDFSQAADTAGWYLSNVYRVHGYSLIVLGFLVVIFARNNMFSLLYSVFFLTSVVKGKWGTLRIAPFLLLGTSFFVVCQYLLLMSVPLGADKVRVQRLAGVISLYVN